MSHRALILVFASASAAVQAAPVITVTGRDALLGSTSFGPAGIGIAPPAVIEGESKTIDVLDPATLTLVGSDADQTMGPFDSVNWMTASWNHSQTFSAGGSMLQASGRIFAVSGGQGCDVGGCFDFEGGGRHENLQTLYFSVSETTPYTASGSSDSQQIIDVERWTGAGWVTYRGLDGAWDPFVTYNAGLDGAPPVLWSYSNTLLAGDYRIYNKRDFYVGNTDVGWSYTIDFTAAGAQVSAVPEPQAFALLLAGLGVILARRRA